MRTLFLVLGLWVLCTSFKNEDGHLEKQLSQSAAENNFFRLRSLLQTAEGKIAPELFLYYTALAENKFDQCASSNRHIETLLGRYQKQLSDSLIIVLLNTRASNYLRLYAYEKAAQTYQELIAKFGSRQDSAAVASYQNMLGLFGALQAVPPQEMHLARDETLPAYRNKFNHLMVPVRTGDTAVDFIFDSGAGLSTISESCARQLGLQLKESGVTVSSGTSIKVQSKLAVADSLWVGRILFRHVVFLVLPDEKLSFPQAGLVIKGIIGFPVIHQMGEVHLRQGGNIYVPQTPVKRQLQNLFLDNQVPVVAAYTGADTLLLNFDTGAKTTELSERYYAAHQTLVDSLGIKMKKHFGSAGGIVEAEVYELPQFRFQIGSQEATLTKVPVHTSAKTLTQNRDGNLGQDVITQFDEMILNFRYMYVAFGEGK